MGKRKYPDGYRNLINFVTGTTDLVPELPGERAASLRKNRELPAKIAKAEFRAYAPKEFEVALMKAFRQAYYGRELPIHFDVVFEKGKIRQARRFTLSEAAFSNHLYKPGQIVGYKRAVRLKATRSATIQPHFTHTVRLNSDGPKRA